MKKKHRRGAAKKRGKGSGSDVMPAGAAERLFLETTRRLLRRTRDALHELGERTDITDLEREQLFDQALDRICEEEQARSHAELDRWGAPREEWDRRLAEGVEVLGERSGMDLGAMARRILAPLDGPEVNGE